MTANILNLELVIINAYLLLKIIEGRNIDGFCVEHILQTNFTI